MNLVLPTSPTPPDDTLQAERARDGQIFVVLLIVVMILTWLLGMLVIQGTFAPRSAFGWMTLLCLIAAGWYGYGYFREQAYDKDPGLILSSAGWLLAAFAAFAQFLTNGSQTNPATTGFGWLAALMILGGAAWSLVRWMQKVRAEQNTIDDPYDLSSALRSAGQK